MTEREEQIQAYNRRNEKNKAWQKRMKIFYTGVFGLLGVDFVLALALRGQGDVSIIWVYLAVAIFIIWILWVFIGIFFIRCPHCDSFLNRVPSNMKFCPQCGTSLQVFPDLEKTEQREHEHSDIWH